MKIEEALRIAKGVMAAHPGFILCGSAALVLCGRLKREVNDIDFVCKKELFDPTGLQTYGDYGPQKDEGYECWKISTDPKTGFYYNVFVHEAYEIDYFRVDGILVQASEQILDWKRKYGRNKDREDLGIISSVSASDIPF